MTGSPPTVLRRLVGLVLALALLAPGSAFGRILYACGMSGKVSASGCCCHAAKMRAAKAESAKGLVGQSKLERSGCCETQDNRRAAASSVLSVSDALALAAGVSELLPVLEHRSSVREQERFRAHSIRGPPGGPPVYAANCSLLI